LDLLALAKSGETIIEEKADVDELSSKENLEEVKVETTKVENKEEKEKKSENEKKEDKE